MSVCIVGSTNAPRPGAASSDGESVVEVVNRIVGYDIEEARLMAEGYREMAHESLAIAEAFFPH
jgi:hypothetical protein